MIKQSTQTRLPVRLLTPAGANATGILPAAVLNGSAQIVTSDGNKSTIALINNTNWFEVDSVQSPGLYHLQVSATDTNTIGNLQYTIYPSGVAFLPFVASDTVDIDISAIKAKTDNLPASPASEVTSTAIKAKTDLIPATPASQADVTAARDAIRGAQNLDISTIAGGNTFVANTDNLHQIKISAGGTDPWASLVSTYNTPGTLGYAVKMIQQVLAGNSKITVDNKRLVVYDVDGTTILGQWYLKNETGAPSIFSIYERTKV